MASPCWYTLVLRYGTERFYLAPRASIQIEEGRDLETLIDDSSGCAGCPSTPDRTWKLKAHFNGGCDMTSAWALFRRLETFLTAACEAGDVTLERTVCRETPLVYEVKKWKLRMTDVDRQQIRATPRTLTMEIEFELTAWVEVGEGAVLVGA